MRDGGSGWRRDGVEVGGGRDESGEAAAATSQSFKAA